MKSTTRQQWDPKAKEFKVGEAVKRTIELNAQDLSAMAFTPLVFSKIDGLGVYPADPLVEDSYDRGSLKGKREFSKKAYFQRLGAACRQNDAKASYNRLLAW
jgi:hypothetical protein